MNATVLRWLILVAVGYATLAALARLLASRALYHPEVASRTTPPEARRLRGPDGHDVVVRHLPNPAAPLTLWFLHGNAEDLGDLEPFLRQLHAAGFAVYAYDYPGYGGSGGSPTEASIYAAARVARTHLRRELGVPPERTLLVGRSLGGGPAVQLATEEPVAGLVLQSTFASVYRVLTWWRLLPFDLFENERKLPAVGCPVLVIHGRQDEVIPVRHGEALFAAARGPKFSWWVPDAGHNDLTERAGPRYLSELRAFAGACRSGRAP
ncbi:MAG: alpha/beta hydrolase [Verrucomicrobia bacterium]|jgi:fermentation-respiration switch protein FrsA (DUF1100 family)|nr:alpha/beta hydrolase [Verrucomicrobiota bacterium]